MAEGQRSERFDRVAKPDPTLVRDRDRAGKEALYSTAPSAAPTSQVLVDCVRCGVESGLSLVATVRLLAPPMLWNPATGTLWARCPACRRRSRLRVRKGQALRALLDRRPGR